MKIYLACGLTHVPRDVFVSYTAFLHELAAALKEAGHGVKYALVDSDPQLASKPFDEQARLCYLWDREMVEDAELVIAEASFPSTGQGIELQIAESRDIPILICIRDAAQNRASATKYENPDGKQYDLQIGEGFVTLMALGLPSVFRVLKYKNASDGIAQVLDTVSLLERPEGQ